MRRCFRPMALGLLVGLLFINVPGWAQEIAQAYQRTGVIGRIDAPSHTIVIEDAGYYLPDSVAVYFPTGRRGSAADLAAGMRVGFNVLGEGGGVIGQVTSVWTGVREQRSGERE